MERELEEDKLSDSDSDGDNSLDLEVPELDDFLEIIERDDAKIKEAKKKNESDIHDTT